MSNCIICGHPETHNIQGEEVCFECYKHIQLNTLPTPDINSLFDVKSFDGILRRAKEYTGLTAQEIKEHTRIRHVVEVRQICMYLARNYADKTLHQIADFFGFNLSTVIYACANISFLAAEDLEFKEKYKKLLKVD